MQRGMKRICSLTASHDRWNRLFVDIRANDLLAVQRCGASKWDCPMKHDFQFDQNVAGVFDDMVARSVPFYDELQRMTVEMARHFWQPGTSIVDLGCATGTTLAALSEVFQDEEVDLVGLDNSEAMLDKARERLGTLRGKARHRLICHDVNDGMPVEDASVVIINWTLQFVRPLHRDRVIQDLYERLRPRGCLILMEKVLIESSLLNRLYIDLYYQFKERHGYSQSEIAGKRESLENVLIPYRVEENALLLRRNGFEIVDVFFRWYNWAGFLAVKLPDERKTG